MSNGEEISEPPPQVITPPSDLFELYMTARAEISLALSFYQLYLKLLFLIDIGKEMLPGEEENLRQEAEDELASPDNYPESGQMESTDKGYNVGPSSETTGRIVVRNEDLSIGLEESKNQQAQKLIPKLKKMDSKIFRALVKWGIVEIKKPSFEDIIMEELMIGLSEEKEKEEKSAVVSKKLGKK